MGSLADLAPQSSTARTLPARQDSRCFFRSKFRTGVKRTRAPSWRQDSGRSAVRTKTRSRFSTFRKAKERSDWKEVTVRSGFRLRPGRAGRCLSVGLLRSRARTGSPGARPQPRCSRIGGGGALASGQAEARRFRAEASVDFDAVEPLAQFRQGRRDRPACSRRRARHHARCPAAAWDPGAQRDFGHGGQQTNSCLVLGGQVRARRAVFQASSGRSISSRKRARSARW